MVKIPKNTAAKVRQMDEDAVTAKLAGLIGSDDIAQQLFLNFLFDRSTAEQFSHNKLSAVSQHRTSHGKIDLLLHNSRVGIIIESKVRDRQKIFQLQKYYDWWLEKTGTPPFVFWLVQRAALGLGHNEFLTRELTWNQLYDYFRGRAVEINQASSRNAVNAFCDWLELSGTLLKPSDKMTVQRRNKGYSYASAEKVLEAIGSSFSDALFRVEPPENELTHRLVIGRKSWASKFGSERVERVWMYYQPDQSPGNKPTFYFRPAIVFWNHKYRTGADVALQHFPEWAIICCRQGMRMWRNKPGKWPGRYKVEITPPFTISPPVKYFFADDELLARARFCFDSGAENEVDVGILCIKRYLQIVDTF